MEIHRHANHTRNDKPYTIQTVRTQQAIYFVGVWIVWMNIFDSSTGMIQKSWAITLVDDNLIF